MAISDKRLNLICVVSDTLRADYLTCYGNKKIYTPNISLFANESAVFDHAYPESLPTIPVRRALHTGRRAYPFRDYKPVKWDDVYLPGWQPVDNGEDTLAENLVEAGYYTGFVSDVPHYFVPGMNFTRGFWQWEFIRGQAEDRWQSPATTSDEDLRKYGEPKQLTSQFPKGIALRHVANNRGVRSEEDTTTARVFRWAMNFLDDNRRIEPFYLMIDCFDPHEAWEAPQSYLELYADPGYKGRTVLSTKYGPAAGVYTPAEIEHVKAHYAGLVTLVDTWFGLFIDKLKRLGLWERSVVFLLSDHGTNLADNPEGIIGKPHFALYPSLMRIPLVVHFPDNEGCGLRFSELIYNLDVTATLYDCAKISIRPETKLDGQSLCRLIRKGEWKRREYLTSRYDHTVWYRDKRYWVVVDACSKPRLVFDLERDPHTRHNLISDTKDIVGKAWERILHDAKGDLPLYEGGKRTDALGQKGDSETKVT